MSGFFFSVAETFISSLKAMTPPNIPPLVKKASPLLLGILLLFLIVAHAIESSKPVSERKMNATGLAWGIAFTVVLFVITTSSLQPKTK